MLFIAFCMCQCFPTCWDSLRLASPLLHSFLPSPLSTYKGERRRKGVKQVESCGWKGRWKGWIWLGRLGEGDARVMRGWSEVGAMVEWRVGCGEGDQKLLPNIRIHLQYCIYSHPSRYVLLGILSFPFHFAAIFSLLSPSPPFYMSISAQYPHSSFRKES